jgi:hypothetical protein
MLYKVLIIFFLRELSEIHKRTLQSAEFLYFTGRDNTWL